MKTNVIARLKATASGVPTPVEAGKVLQKLEAILGKGHVAYANTGRHVVGQSVSWHVDGQYTAELILHTSYPKSLDFDFHAAGLSPLKDFITVISYGGARDLLKMIALKAQGKIDEVKGPTQEIVRQLAKLK
jgi:hypothetical protein